MNCCKTNKFMIIWLTQTRWLEIYSTPILAFTTVKFKKNEQIINKNYDLFK